MPNSSKESQALFFGSLMSRRVWKRIVNAYYITGKPKTAFLCIVTECEHVIEGLVFKKAHVVRTVIGNIDANLFHNRNGFRSYMSRVCAGAFNFETVSGVMLQQSFAAQAELLGR